MLMGGWVGRHAPRSPVAMFGVAMFGLAAAIANGALIANGISSANAASRDALVFEFEGESLAIALADMRRVGIAPDGDVTFCFDRTGARAFGRLTSERVGETFRIVFDGEVLSEPIIRTPITGGCGMVTNPGGALREAVRALGG